MNIAVIGGGITGLTAGLRLAQQGHKVTLFEMESQPGGLASAINVGGESLDRFYHHTFVNDTHLLSLIDELGLTSKLKWYEPMNSIYLNGHLHPFTTPYDLLAFKPLSLLSRVRMGLLVLVSGLVKDYRPYEKITAREWIIKYSGKDSYQKIWGPLLKSKFDIDSDKISGTWIWNKFKLRGSSRGKNISKEKLGYLDGGFITLIKRLEEEIKKLDGTIYLNTPVKKISRYSKDPSNVKPIIPEPLWNIETNHGKHTFDAVLFTAAPELLVKVYGGFPDKYKECIRSIKYKANICVILELTKSLSPFYWTTISEEGFPFVLVIEHTNLVGQRNYGSHIVYVSRYIDPNDEFYMASDKEILSSYISGLERIFPDFSPNHVVRSTISRATYAQPVVEMGFGGKIPYIRTPSKGLYLASMSQIYPEDRGLNYGIRLGESAASNILDDL